MRAKGYNQNNFTRGRGSLSWSYIYIIRLCPPLLRMFQMPDISILFWLHLIYISFFVIAHFNVVHIELNSAIFLFIFNYIKCNITIIDHAWVYICEPRDRLEPLDG